MVLCYDMNKDRLKSIINNNTYNVKVIMNERAHNVKTRMAVMYNTIWIALKIQYRDDIELLLNILFLGPGTFRGFSTWRLYQTTCWLKEQPWLPYQTCYTVPTTSIPSQFLHVAHHKYWFKFQSSLFNTIIILNFSRFQYNINCCYFLELFHCNLIRNSRSLSYLPLIHISRIL